MKLTTTILALASAATTALHAADYYWWVPGNPTTGGSGQWNATATANFSDNGSTYNPTMYSSAATSNAIFAGSGGTVTFAASMIMDNWQVDAPNYIFNLAATGRTFTVNQFMGTHWGTAQFTGTATPTFVLTAGTAGTPKVSTLAANILTSNATFSPAAYATLILSGYNTMTTFTLGITASAVGSEVRLAHINAAGQSGNTKLVLLNSGSGVSNTLSTTFPLLTFGAGFTIEGNRNLILNSFTDEDSPDPKKFLFEKLTASNAIINQLTPVTFTCNADTIFTGLGYVSPMNIGLAGATTVNSITTSTNPTLRVAGTGSVIWNLAIMQGSLNTLGVGTTVHFSNTNEVLLTDAMDDSTYTGVFRIGDTVNSPALYSVVRTTTLNNNSEKGVFGKSTTPIYIGEVTNSLCKLIYDSSTADSTNKDFSIGAAAHGNAYFTLESAGTGKFEITGNIGQHINGTYGIRYVTLSGTGDGRIGPDSNGVGGNIYNYLPGRTTGTASDSGPINITKEGLGTWVLDGNNTYTGRTIVSAGTLLLNGNNTDVTASGGYVGTGSGGNWTGYALVNDGHYRVETGGTLGGGGTWDVDTQKYVGGYIKGHNDTNNSNLILVQSGGFLAPGRAIGQVGVLTIDAAGLVGGNNFSTVRMLRMAEGAKFAFDLSGSVADRIDFWNVSNASLITFGGAAINLTLSGSVAEGDYEAVIFLFYSDSGSNVMSNPFFSGLTIGTLGDRIESAQIWYNADSISIKYTVAAIPEPSALALLGLALGVVALLRRKS